MHAMYKLNISNVLSKVILDKAHSRDSLKNSLDTLDELAFFKW